MVSLCFAMLGAPLGSAKWEGVGAGGHPGLPFFLSSNKYFRTKAPLRSQENICMWTCECGREDEAAVVSRGQQKRTVNFSPAGVKSRSPCATLRYRAYV